MTSITSGSRIAVFCALALVVGCSSEDGGGNAPTADSSVEPTDTSVAADTSVAPTDTLIEPTDTSSDTDAPAGESGAPPIGMGACPTAGAYGTCTTNAQCDDGVFCNGEEICKDGRCLHQAAPCPGSACVEKLKKCGCTSSAACTSDGLFCNGSESCIEGVCSSPRVGPCNGRACNETTDTCGSCTSAAACDDGIWCNGTETCISGMCRSFGPACGTAPCRESTRECGCATDADCTAFLTSPASFCNGIEKCISGRCVKGAYPCAAPNGICDELTDTCKPGAVPTCSGDAQCQDDNFCNGAERCAPGAPGADARGCAPSATGSACLPTQTCKEADQRCDAICTTDADGDGHRSIACGGDDCDDNDPNRFPGKPETCAAGGDVHDEDCDPATFGNLDADGDGAISAACCNWTGTAMTCGTDCNDSKASVRPGMSEVCNGIDDDCDGMIDEGVLVPMYYDADGDGSGAPGCMRMVCSGTVGFVANGNDCDDTNPEIKAGAQSCGTGGGSTTVYICDPGGVWRATSCTSGKCVSQPNGTGLCL